MKMPLKYIISLLIIIINVNEVWSQQKNTRFTYYKIDDGLSQNHVECMLRDSKGFMWFGTWNGLNRFDSYTFQVFKRDNSSHSLTDNFIYALAEDHFGNIWIGTDKGLNIYDYENDIVILPQQEQWMGEAIFKGRITSILRDKNNLVWVGTTQGIHVIQVIDNTGKIDIIKKFVPPMIGISVQSAEINCLYEDSAGNIWAGTNDGLFIYDHTKDHFVNFQSQLTYALSSNVINTLYEDKYSRLWIGTYYGLVYFDRKTKEQISYQHDVNDEKSLAHDVIRDIVEDYHGKLIIATLGGVSIFDDHSKSFLNIKESYGNNYGLNNEFVSKLLSDPQGNIWIGTENGGVNRYNIFHNQFSVFEKDMENRNGLSHYIVNSVFEDENFIWIGTAGGGLNKYDKTSRRFSYYISQPGVLNGINNNFVTSIIRASDGKLYVGTWGGGVNRMDNQRKGRETFYQYPVSTTEGNSLPDAFVSSLAEDTFGNIWVGTRSGLAKIQAGSDNVDVFDRFVDEKPLPSIGAVAFDCQGNLWLGTLTGLFKLHSTPDGNINIDHCKVTSYYHDPANTKSLSSNFIITILKDQNCNMWFGNYGNGFSKFVSAENNKEDHFVNFDESHGLSNNVVYGILEDNSGNLWLSTDYGLSKFDVKTQRFKNYYTSDGLKNNQYYWSAFHKNKNGRLYFGGVNGLNFFSPDSLYDKVTEPALVINEIRVNNRRINKGDNFDKNVTLTGSIFTAEGLVLSYKMKEFSIGFTALIYDQPRKIRYAYKLVGYDPDWIEVDASRRVASYMNLPGGEYTFLVRATDSNNYWSTSPQALNIRIIPPFYTTVWFAVLIVALVILMVISYVRFKLYSVRQQKIILEKQVRIRTAEIEAQKEKLLSLTLHLNESLKKLEVSDSEIREQNKQLETKNQQIVLQKDKLAKLHEKVQKVNSQQLNFFTNISHEFRTSLSLIITPLEQLLKNQFLSVNKDVKNNLELINKNAGRLLRLINQLMDIRKIESGHLKLQCTPSDIVSYIKDITYSFTPISDINKIRLNFTSSDPAIMVYFDSEKIENIMYNIISNAFKYNSSGGKVDISVRKLETAHDYHDNFGGLTIIDNIRKHHTYESGFVEIKVTDTGIGIDPQKAYQIFQRFNRLDTVESNKIKGTGIGMYLTKELTALHKGSLFLESKPGKGAVFTVLLQLGMDHLQEKEISLIDNNPKLVVAHEMLPSTSDIHADNNVCNDVFDNNILIVEDNLELRALLKDSFSEHFNIIEACNGKDGIEKALEFLPDLILSDIMMPEMDGLTMCKTLKLNPSTSHIPVILLTARSETSHFIEGLETGADDYITKPFNFQLLQAKIRSIVENRCRLKEAFKTTFDPIPKDLIINKQNEEFLHKVVAFVEQEISNPELNVQILAQQMCISRSLLHKKLTAISGHSANDFITSIRLKKSLVLLRELKGSIAEVAYEVGFNDPKYFSRCFKKYFKLSPTEFLNQSLDQSVSHQV
jgi:ligand-binding sensor domain-containing protein/signal transduction histidine kinase/DNA-binding response OmpR family regulator